MLSIPALSRLGGTLNIHSRTFQSIKTSLKCQLCSSSYHLKETHHPSGIEFSHGGNVSDRSDFFQRVLARFPGGDDKNRCLSLAYGSGVFQQARQEQVANNMTDFLFVVQDSKTWHQQNLDANPSDYSGLMRMLGSKNIAALQKDFGAQLYFNTLVPFENGLIKYGVISRDDFLSDLLDWDTLYAAGRLQKPVNILEKPHKAVDQDLHLSLRMNLTSAMHTALLLLPDRFTEVQLYTTLASLSYAGDFRMTIGEDRNKVHNIVKGSLPHFQTLYDTRLAKMRQFIHKEQSGNDYEQDVSPAGRHHHLSMLPKGVQMTLVDSWNSDGRARDLEDVLRAAAFERDSGDTIHQCLESIVKMTSVTQAIKGVLTAGGYKTVRYSYAKLRKMLISLNDKTLRGDVHE